MLKLQLQIGVQPQGDNGIDTGIGGPATLFCTTGLGDTFIFCLTKNANSV
jgi:hypothetical protein